MGQVQLSLDLKVYKYKSIYIRVYMHVYIIYMWYIYKKSYRIQ